MNNESIDSPESNTTSESKKSIGSDKFLIAIVIGAVLLVVLTFAVMLLRPKPEYRPEDSPENIAHNYLLALQQGDYGRAYGYLSPSLLGMPADVGEFIENIEDRSYYFRLDMDKSLQVESGVVISAERASVTVRETRFYSGGIFDSNQTTDTFKMSLKLEDGQWKIWDGDYYFRDCWNDTDGCR